MEPNFKIIGGDGREYGAADADELRSWIREGRVASATMVWSSDRGAWGAAASYDEFRAEFKPVPVPGPVAFASGDLIPVGFFARLGAYIVDVLILLVVTNIVLSLAPHSWRSEVVNFLNDVKTRPFSITPEELTRLLLIELVMLGVYSAASSVYFILMHGLRGATVGKMIVGARVVNLDGSPVNMGRATMRYMGETLSWMSFGIGYLMIAFREDKRGLHDLVAGTRVVYKTPE